MYFVYSISLCIVSLIQMCHNSMKRFWFLFKGIYNRWCLGHKHIQTILAKSLKWWQCCQLFSSDSPRKLVYFISFECWIKTCICQFPLPVCNFQCSQGKDCAQVFRCVTSCFIIKLLLQLLCTHFRSLWQDKCGLAVWLQRLHSNFSPKKQS